MFSIVVAPLYNPTNSTQRAQFQTYVFLSCGYLMTNDVEFLFMFLAI